MAILQTLVASSALALALLAAAPSPANALVTVGNNHFARHVSPAHEGIAKRKRNTHKNRKRCVAPPVGGTPPTTDTPSTDTPTNNNNNNGNNNNNNGPPPGSNGGYAGGGKVGLAWAPDVNSNYIGNAVSGNVG